MSKNRSRQEEKAMFANMDEGEGFRKDYSGKPLYENQKHPKTGASWKLDRRHKFRSKTTADPNKRPEPHTRSKFWVRAHIRNGHPVKGHYRNA